LTGHLLNNEARHPPGFFRLCAVFSTVWQLSPNAVTIALQGPLVRSKKMVWINALSFLLDRWRPENGFGNPARRQIASGTRENEVAGVRWGFNCPRI
jgi:hypothetical protein